MSSIRINLSMALITLVILISALEIQHGVLANEQVSNLFFLFYKHYFVVAHFEFIMHILNDEQNDAHFERCAKSFS